MTQNDDSDEHSWQQSHFFISNIYSVDNKNMAGRHNFNLILIIAMSIYKVMTEQERCLEKSGYDLDCENEYDYDYELNDMDAESTGKIVTFYKERFLYQASSTSLKAQ